MSQRVLRRVERLEQRSVLGRQLPPEITIVYVNPDGTPVSAVRWSRDENRWIDVPVPTDGSTI